ncbi:MAG: response regulator, partial [Mangrovicoccus sp.]
DMFLPTRFVADPGRIRQILTNLIGNAVKFTSKGHVLVRVTGYEDDATPGAHRLSITVEDTGIGIAEDKADLIFGEFNQVEDERNRKFEGTGLGLAITKQLVELMGGEIWVDSILGEGSCFGFQLCISADESGGQLNTKVPETLNSALVVDDLPINRMILEKQLSTLGLRVTTHRSGPAALADDPSRFDLIITDHEMPEMSGMEFARTLRDRNICAPIMMLTSNPAHVTREDSEGILNAVLQKPMLRRELYNRLRDLGNVVPLTHQAPSAEPAIDDGPRKMRLLAAEDNLTNQLVFSKMVKHLNLTLEFANNGIEAVEKMKTFEPDLIFMDISMPEMDGKEATRNIRAYEAETGASRTPICALTAHAMDGDSHGILEAGLDFYLTKPLRKGAICEMILNHAPEDAAQVDPRASPAAKAG